MLKNAVSLSKRRAIGGLTILLSTIKITPASSLSAQAVPEIAEVILGFSVIFWILDF